MISEIEVLLLRSYPSDIVKAVVDSFADMQIHFAHRKWKPSELEAGFFVEAVRRTVELELFGQTSPIGVALRPFSNGELQKYESAGSGDVTFRIHIPRVLWSVYNLRNKRGVGHLSPVSPNLMDATYVVSACSWVLAELVRYHSSTAAEHCQSLVDSLVEKQYSLVFEDGSIKRVLDSAMRAKDQVLVLLYVHSEPVLDETLRTWVEYRGASQFRTRVLMPLHQERLIEYRDKHARLTPKGVVSAEKLLLDWSDRSVNGQR